MHYFIGQYNLKNKSKKFTFKCEKSSANFASPVYSQTRFTSGIRVIFEGKISNIKELGEIFNINKIESLSFSGIILKLYKKKSVTFFDNLKGEYAFVIHDLQKNKIILHRDRMGYRSLYYSYKDKVLTFGTLIKPVLKKTNVKKELNLERIYNFFRLRALNFGSDTEFKNVYNLMPGEIITVDERKVTKKQTKNNDLSDISLNEKELEDQFYLIVKESIESYFSIHNKASIAFSGGLDTNVIVSFAAKNNIPIDTFTVKFKTKCIIKNRDYDMAKKRSKKHNTEHHELIATANNFVNNLENRIKSYDRLVPINYLNNDCIYEFVSKSSDIVFTGDGVEEQLGFYPWVHMPYCADILLNNTFQGKKVMYKNLLSSTINHFFKLSNKKCNFNGDELFSNDFLGSIKNYNPSDYVKNCETSKYKNLQNPSILNNIFYLALKKILIPNKVLASEFLSKKHSLEIYAPYLRENLVDFLEKIPANLKYKGTGVTNSKYIFRKAVSRLIGKDDAFTPFKSGSNLPLSEWFLEEKFEKKIKEILSFSRIKKSGIFDPEKVKKIVNDHYENRGFYNRPLVPMLLKKGVDNQWQIVALISFQLWWEENFDS